MTFFFKEKEKSYLEKKDKINLRNFYQEFFIKILSSDLIPEVKEFGFYGNLWLDFKNQNIKEFFEEITVILTNKKNDTNQKLIKSFEDCFNKLKIDPTKKTDQEFQKFLKNVKKKFLKENKDLFKKLKEQFQNVNGNDLNSFLNNCSNNDISFEKNKKRGEIQSDKKINREENYLMNFFLEARVDFVDKILLKVQGRENNFNLGFKKILKSHDLSNKSEDRSKIFKKYFTPHGILNHKEKEKRFGKDFQINNLHKDALETRKKLAIPNLESNQSNFTDRSLEIKFSDLFFNLFNNASKLKKNAKIEKNEENKKFLKDVFFNLFILGNLDVVLLNTLFKTKDGKTIDELKLIDFEMSINFSSSFGSSNEFILDNKKFFFEEKNNLSLKEKCCQFFTLFGLMTFSRKTSDLKNKNLKSLISLEKSYKANPNFRKIYELFSNFLSNFSDSDIISLMNEMSDEFNSNKNNIKNLEIKKILETRDKNFKKELNEFQDRRKKFYCKLKEKLNKISISNKDEFEKEIKKSLKNYNDEQIDVLWTIKQKNKTSGDDLSPENAELLDKFLEKNSYLYVKSNKQKISNFTLEIISIIDRVLLASAIIVVSIIVLKLLKITDLISKICLKALEKIETKFGRKFEKIENFLKIEISFRVLQIFCFVHILLFFSFISINEIIFKNKEDQILNENKEISTFLELGPDDPINLVSANHFIELNNTAFAA